MRHLDWCGDKSDFGFSLYDKNGKSPTDQNEIMEIEVDYYKKLYKSTNPDNDKLKKYIENTKVHIMKNSKSCGKQEVDVR